MKKHAAPIIAAVLLLLPVLYVGSYFALVVPGDYIPLGTFRTLQKLRPNYRYGGNLAARIFWPLEQIDRKVRPVAWENLERKAVLIHGEKNGPVYYSP